MTTSRFVLLVRPRSPNERFGLGPFFRVEPLGLEYVAATLRNDGHCALIVDERFSAPLSQLIRQWKPDLVGISCMHTVDIPTTLAAARQVKRAQPGLPVLVGGHVVALYPDPFFDSAIDALALGDAENTLPEFMRRYFSSDRDSAPPGFFVRRVPGNNSLCFERGPAHSMCDSLDRIERPARDLVASVRSNYLCVHKQPLWALETARGCPYRCSFCSTSLRNERKFYERGIDNVERDFWETGKNVFVVDDLFFYPPRRSLELAQRLLRGGLKKDWLLVQTRLDTVARHPEVMQAWRPLARNIDLFFGFEAPTDAQLSGLVKDMSIDATEEGVRVARHYGFGVTGNFVVDPDWGETEFQAMWSMVDRLKLNRLGYTILTPLPGTPLFSQMSERIIERDWSKWDMHHLLYEPRLGRERFFELFVECWRRNVLSADHAAFKLAKWIKGLSLPQILVLLRVLWRTQRMLKVHHYLDETFPLQVPAKLG
ncbi:MAG TPA: radical SAM protein [Polyangiaceae bacterium]